MQFTAQTRYHVVVRVEYTYSVFKSELPCFFLNKTIQSPNFELVRSPRIDSKEPMPPDGVAWQAIQQPYSYSVLCPHRLSLQRNAIRGRTLILLMLLVVLS